MFSDVHKTWARQRDLSETPKSQSFVFNFWETLTSLEIKTLILKQNPGGTNIRSITKHESLCLRLGQHQGCNGPLVEVLAEPLVEHLVVEALVGQHDPL